MHRHRLPFSITTLLFALLAVGCAAPQAAPIATLAPTITLPTPTIEPTAVEASANDAPEIQESVPSTGGVIRYEVIPELSEARYRVREQLVNFDLPNDAVGSTKQVSGAIVVQPDGTIDSTASQFTVDMASITSDQSRRDNFVRRNVLQTDQYPTATFVPTGISGLSSPLPESGEAAFELTGNLTIRDVTKEVTWKVIGTVEGDQASGQAVTNFKFADFNLTQPQVPVVLSIEDNIILELDLTVRRSE